MSIAARRFLGNMSIGSSKLEMDKTPAFQTKTQPQKPIASFKPSRRKFLVGSTALTAVGLSGTIFGRPEAAQFSPIKLVVAGTVGSFTYNGKSPGPTLMMDPGDTLDIELINELNALHDDCTDDVNQFHGLHTTNLHMHGLHVSPTTDASGEFDADNIFVNVTPKGQFVSCEEICGTSVAEVFREHRNQFRFEIGPDHPSGTFWYHAHKHGATQSQVAGGLVGPLIVRDKPGTMPPYITEAAEKIFIIMNEGLVLVDLEGGGEVDPTLTLRPGEVQRWRIINAQASGVGGGSFARLTTNVPDLDIYQIAFDGLTLPHRFRIDQYDRDEPWENPAALAPGNRMDLIVRVPDYAEERSIIVDLGATIRNSLSFTSTVERIVLNIDIVGDAIDHLWSEDTKLPAPEFADFDDTPLAKRVINFQGGFQIDGAQYSGETKQTMRLDDAEEWTIENNTSAVHAHHIHVNPFLITHINGIELASDDPRRRWQDTVALPFSDNNGPGSVTYKTRFETFTGKFVIHCHVLRHEDRGMMQTVEIIA
ncbi:multicopper oxidase domain-containing protein [Roseibium polysiphoniae]|uniref:multicopper oxidase family protein n=1 Tax=Roseibium polysiphoniae TaxID=2571221 RepID=UPI00329939D9